MRVPPSLPDRERGIATLWMAVFVMTMLVFIALGTDMAKLVVTRTQLQNAADAAALAGAGALDSLSLPAVVDTAVSQAIATASRNEAYESAATPVMVSPSDVAVDTSALTVTVRTRRESSAGTPVIPHFLQVVGIHTLDASAAATAQGRWICPYVPFAVLPPDTGFFSRGVNYLIKNAPPNGFYGGYRALQFPACPGAPCEQSGGADRYRCLIMNGYWCCEYVKIGDCLDSKEGDMSGPTTLAIGQLIDTDSDSRLGILYADYHGNRRRVVFTPITLQMGGPPHGKCYTVIGLGVFFLTQYANGSGNKNTVYAEYLGTPDELGMSSKRWTVRLIH